METPPRYTASHRYSMCVYDVHLQHVACVYYIIFCDMKFCDMKMAECCNEVTTRALLAAHYRHYRVLLVRRRACLVGLTSSAVELAVRPLGFAPGWRENPPARQSAWTSSCTRAHWLRSTFVRSAQPFHSRAAAARRAPRRKNSRSRRGRMCSL